MGTDLLHIQAVLLVIVHYTAIATLLSAWPAH